MRLAWASSLPAIALLGLVAGGAMAAMDDEDGFDINRALHLSEKGMRALRADNLSKAAKLFDRSLAIVPRYPGALVGQGHIAMRERRFVEALSFFQEAQEGYRVLGDALYEVRLDAFNRAQDRINGLRARMNDIDRFLIRQDNIQATSGAPTQARNPAVSQMRSERIRLERELDDLRLLRPPVTGGVDPVPGEIHFHIGNALLNMGRLEDAIESWQRCAEKVPDFPLVHYNLAVAYWQLSRHGDAEAALRKSEELGFEGNPNFRRDLEQALAGS